MTKKFHVIITRKENVYVASCREMPDIIAQADSKEAVLEKIQALIKKKLDDGSDGGVSPKPHPNTPTPRGPVIVTESHEFSE